MSQRYLKIKVKHLAEEARIIRFEEKKVHGMERWKLQYHRKTIVREAARQAQLAYAMLRGRTFTDTMPGYSPTGADRLEVRRMVQRYGDFGNVPDEVEKWFNLGSGDR